MNYKQFLQSSEWKAVRDRVVQRDGKCVICGSVHDLEAHHIGYKEGRCNASKIVTLCHLCHESVTHAKNAFECAVRSKSLSKRLIEQCVRQSAVQYYEESFLKSVDGMCNISGANEVKAWKAVVLPTVYSQLTVDEAERIQRVYKQFDFIGVSMVMLAVRDYKRERYRVLKARGLHSSEIMRTLKLSDTAYKSLSDWWKKELCEEESSSA